MLSPGREIRVVIMLGQDMKQLATVLLVAVITFAGCQDPGSPTESESRQPSNEPFDITSMVTVDEIKPALEDDARPTTAEQLKSDFVSLLETDPEQALVDYVDWDAVPESKRLEKLGGLLTLPYSIGRDKQYELLRSKLYTISEYCRLIDCPVDEYNEERETPVTHLVELEYKISENGTQTGTIDIGERDGRYYLYPEAD